MDHVSNARKPAPEPLEANDQLVTAAITAGWAVALVVLLAVRSDIPPLKRSRERAARRRAEADQP